MSHGKARKTERTFRLGYEVAIQISANPGPIWELLTDAARFPSWNSTVSSIEGTIALGQKLSIRVPLAPKRTFTPRVTAFVPTESMQWSDGMAPMFKGVRTFSLTPQGDGTTEFRMKEEFAGLMLPMIKGSLPNFAPAFEAYASDLKRAAEGRAS